MLQSATAIKKQFTWDDYQLWPNDERWEVINGEAFAMSPAPTLRHQTILVELTARFHEYFMNKSCQAFVAPTDVKLSDADIVQPDLLIVCDSEKLKGTHVEGAPDLIVEILSPSTAAFDRVRKMRLYAANGVKEVWLITPYPWLAEVFVLDGKSYRLTQVCEKNDTLNSVTFPGLNILLSDIFNYSIDPSEQIAMVKEGHPQYGKEKTL